MKKNFILLVAGFVGAAVMAQTNDYSNRSVRDPVQLGSKLNADMSAVSDRLSDLEASTNASGTFKTTTIGSLIVQTNAVVHGSATLGAGLTHTGTLFRTSTTQMVFTAASQAAPTNSASRGLLVQVNGTNFWIGLSPVNN